MAINHLKTINNHIITIDYPLPYNNRGLTIKNRPLILLVSIEKADVQVPWITEKEHRSI